MKLIEELADALRGMGLPVYVDENKNVEDGLLKISEAKRIADEKEMQKALIVLEEYFSKALNFAYVVHPVAWALYQTWKYFDEKAQKKEEKQDESDA